MKKHFSTSSILLMIFPAVALITSKVTASPFQKDSQPVPVCYIKTPQGRIINIDKLCGKVPVNPVISPNNTNSNPDSVGDSSACTDKDSCIKTMGSDTPPLPKYLSPVNDSQG